MVQDNKNIDNNIINEKTENDEQPMTGRLPAA